MKKTMISMLVGALLCSVSPGLTSAVASDHLQQTQQQVQDSLPLARGLTKHVLDNGLTVYLLPRKDPQQSLEVRMVVRAGSLQEKEDERGLAHFVEHMAFNGTKNYPGQRIFKRLEKHGIQLGADINAVTSLGSTTYQLSIPQAKKDSLWVALETMKEWAQGITMTSEAFDHERRIIVEEWRLRQGVGWRINAPLQTLRYQGSASEQRDPIGLLEIVRGAPVRRARAFYARYYQPQNTALIVVGDFDRKRVIARIEKDWSDWRASGETTSKDWGRFTSVAKPQDRTLLLWDKEQSDRFIQVMLQHTHEQSRNTASRQWRDRLERLTFAVLKERFQKMQEAEIVKRVQAPEASWYLSPSASQTLFIVAPKRNQSYERALRVLAREVKRLRDWGPMSEELERVKKARMDVVTQQAQNEARYSNGTYANRWADAVSYDLPMIDKKQEWQMLSTFHARITPKHIQALAQSLLQDSVVKIAAVGPRNKESKLVTKEAIWDAWQESSKEKTRPFSLEVRYQDLEKKEWPKARIVKSEAWPTIHSHAQSERIRLKNGVTVTLLSDRRLLGDAQVHVVFSGGYQSVARHGALWVSEALRLPMVTGVENLKAKDIRHYAKKHHLSLLNYATLTQHGLRGEARWDEMPALMRLLVARLNAPQWDQRIWQESRQESQERMKNVPVERKFMDAMHIASMKNGATLLVNERQFAAPITLDALRDLEAQLLGYLPAMRVVVTSSESLSRMKKVILPALSALENRVAKPVTPFTVVVKPKAEQKDQVFAWNQAPKTMVQMHYADSQAKWTPENAEKTALMQLMVNWVLREKLRTEESGVYVVAMNQLLNRDPSNYYLGRLNFTAAPERADALIVKAKEALDRIRQHGFSTANLRQSKAAFRQMTRRQEKDTYYHNELLAQYVGDRALWQEHIKARRTIQNVSAEDIHALVKDWWKNGPVVYQLTPQKGQTK